MSLPGPFPVTPIQQSSLQDMQIRPMQKITAAVVQVTGVQAILAINGYPVVAKLASQDQAAALMSQKYAQFIVSQVNDKEIILKFIKPEGQSTGVSGKSGGGDVAVRLMGEMGLTATSDQLLITRALLGQNLTITPERLNELFAVLNQMGAWGETEAQLAAALIAAGLPLTPASLMMVSKNNMRIAEQLPNILEQLRSLLERLPNDNSLRGMLDQVIALLENTIPDISNPPGELSERLHALAQLFGSSIESLLSDQVKNSKALWPENNLMILSQLSQELKQEGHTETAESVDQLIEQARLNQFLNVKPDPIPGKGAWGSLDFMIQIPTQGGEARNVPAHIKISYREGDPKRKIDPNFTRIVVQVDLEPDKPIQIDLSILNRQIRADILTSVPTLAQYSREQLPELIERLSMIGYDVKFVNVNVGPIVPAGENPISFRKNYRTTEIDLEV